MLCWYFRPTLRVMFWWAYFTSNIVVSGCHIKIILLNVAYIRSSLVAYIATQHAQHAVRRQFRYPTSPPTLGVSKVNSSKWLNCSSQSHFLVAFWSRVICGWFSVNMPRNSIEKQASPFLHRHQQRNSHVTSVVNVTIFKLVYGNARAKSCNVNVQFLFLARIVAVTASNHFCLLPAYPWEHCTFQMPKNELTLPKGGCTPPLITLWSYPASPRTALITVAPILDRSLPTVYQLTAQHSLLRSY